jgi:flagellar protein FlaE
MGLNPRDYDIRELREAAGMDPEGQRDRSWTAGPDPVTFDSIEAELAFSELAGDVPASRPYLSTVPRGYLAELYVFRWLEYLVDRSGVHETLDALGLYQELDWIDAAVEQQLRTYLSLLNDPHYDPPGLSSDDHQVTLRFLERLSALAER